MTVGPAGATPSTHSLFPQVIECESPEDRESVQEIAAQIVDAIGDIDRHCLVERLEEYFHVEGNEQ